MMKLQKKCQIQSCFDLINTSNLKNMKFWKIKLVTHANLKDLLTSRPQIYYFFLCIQFILILINTYKTFMGTIFLAESKNRLILDHISDKNIVSHYLSQLNNQQDVNSFLNIIIIIKGMAKNGRTRRNSKISFKRRQDLIKMVLNKGFNIRDAAHRLKIKTTTAQNILRKYNSTGQIFDKTMKKNSKRPLFDRKKTQQRLLQNNIQNEFQQAHKLQQQKENNFLPHKQYISQTPQNPIVLQWNFIQNQSYVFYWWIFN